MVPSKIMICTDFSENAVKARLVAIEYAKKFQAELVILHVINSHFFGYPSYLQTIPIEFSTLQKSVEEGVRQELELLTTDCRRDVDNTSGFVRIGIPDQEIVTFAQENDVSMIVIGTHGETGIRKLMMGSTAENVIRSATCPVLTVRSKEA